LGDFVHRRDLEGTNADDLPFTWPGIFDFPGTTSRRLVGGNRGEDAADSGTAVIELAALYW
jgi:hypothetical protein